MILADTSVWIDHLRQSEPQLVGLLEAGKVRMHSLVLGELACGSLKDRALRLTQWRSMPRIASVNDTQAIAFIEWHRLMSRGLSFIDIHLLAACAASTGLRLWTRDRRLAEVAQHLNLALDQAI
ncbi:type II toxin-antitoxin system VapC family toxin [Nevskia sp.]|uniref:type II toxin-antitoxin system VapC family toxin n=1 Tax=Nevskia sp. TaxID=1929292 RepID=UPI0025E8D37B|nr:type II toxin-antitoxin system VapC family toxin [Nevskia sp.]